MVLKEGQVFHYDGMNYVVLTSDVDNDISYYICGNVDSDGNPLDTLSVFYYNDVGNLMMMVEAEKLNKMLPKFQAKLENEIRNVMIEMGEK